MLNLKASYLYEVEHLDSKYYKLGAEITDNLLPTKLMTNDLSLTPFVPI